MDPSRAPGRPRAGFLSGFARLALASLAGLITWLGLTGTVVLGEAYTRARVAPSQADAIVVLGAAAYGRRPSPVYRERLRHALALHRQGVAATLVLTGGKRLATDLSEAEVGRRWLLDRGVEPAAVLVETSSQSTAENLANAERVMAAHGLSSAVVVSDPLHLARARLLAERVGIEVQTSATPTTRFRSLRTKVPFLLRECGFLSSALLGLGRGVATSVPAALPL